LFNSENIQNRYIKSTNQMIYSQQQPHKNLRDYVRCYWRIENNTKDFLSYTIFPDGFFDLLICYNADTIEGNQ